MHPWGILFVGMILAFASSGLDDRQSMLADIVVISLLIFLIPAWCRACLALLHPIIARLGFQPRRAPKAYVKALFDSYAKRFDQSLFIDLAYTGPNLVRRIVGEHVPAGNGNLIIGDLGCGTGACGPLFERLTRELVGVDLSSEMLVEAEKRDVYDRLHQDDMIKFLEKQNVRFDLLIAADVFVYIGDLDPVIKAAKEALCPGGWLAFTIEHEVCRRYRLDKSGRYKHAPDYVEALADAADFTIIDRHHADMRLECGHPVKASVWLLQRNQPTPKSPFDQVALSCTKFCGS